MIKWQAYWFELERNSSPVGQRMDFVSLSEVETIFMQVSSYQAAFTTPKSLSSHDQIHRPICRPRILSSTEYSCLEKECVIGTYSSI